jgi:Fur family peroxide stress response transcriptional regulator
MSTELRLNQIIDKLKARHFRLTPQRIAIVRVLLTLSHPTVQQVYSEVRGRFPTTGLGTVYKTVTLLNELGEAFELNLGGASSHYDGIEPYPHPHFICPQCGEIVNVEVPRLADLLERTGSTMNGWMITPRVDIWAICPRCQSAGTLPEHCEGGGTDQTSV